MRKIKKQHHEAHSRSILKGFSWRIIASVTTMSLVYWHTRDLTLTLEVGVLETILKLIFYYVHERAWHKIDWGRKYHYK